jgi:hypothetical protein
MGGNTTRTQSTEGQDSVCPRCHGTKGTGGIFGCKCVDNSRLLKKNEGKVNSEE